MNIDITKKQLELLLDYFYKCESVAQDYSEQPKWTERLRKIHDKVMRCVNEN